MVILILLSVWACTDHGPKEIVLSGPVMGTFYRVNVITLRPINAEDKASLARDIEEAMDRVNQSMSTYITSSEISKFNRLPKNASARLSPELHEVMSEALHISDLSNGAFDVTLGKAIRLWGFSEDGAITEQPSVETLKELRQTVGYQHLRLQGHQLTKLVDGLEVNLSAIAKGYAVDKVAQAIEALGYQDYLVDIGGELRAQGQNVKGQLWRIGVEKPHALGGVAQIVELNNQAIATSGDYRNFLTIDGQQFSHTIDSVTLKPIFHKLASVSVVSNKTSTADALATALLAMGETDGVTFAEANSIAAYFIIRESTEGNYKVHVTRDFKPNLAE